MMEGPIVMKYEVKGVMMERGANMRGEHSKMKGGFL
jgi:hypothetical protein